ncbi:MAG: hypothetical protein IJZ25_02455 [Lachnospiraceae bacterium]|nr:hypothetical protein [Lachnospiraceae bacterium]
MKKAFRKLKMTTNVKPMKVILIMSLVIMIVAVAYAKTEKDTTSTSRTYVTSGYYAKGNFKVTLTYSKIFSWVSTSVGTAEGEAVWTNSNGKEVDYQNFDLALPYAVVRFSYDGGSYTTSSAEFLPIWAYSSVGTLKCNEAYEYKPRLWNAASGKLVKYASDGSITAER